MPRFLTTFYHFRIRLEANRFSKWMMNHLIDRAFSNIQDKEELDNKIQEIKAKRNNFRNRMLLFFQQFYLDYYNKTRIINYSSSYDEVMMNLNYLIQAKKMELDEYMNPEILIDLLRKERDISIFFSIAKDFKNFNLYENGQGNFNKLLGLVQVEDEQIRDIVDVMIYTKNAGCPVKQKKVVKYFDSNRPESENLNELKEALLFAHEYNFLEKLKIEDFIHLVKYKRKPLTFVKNYYKIINYHLPIPFEKFKYFNLDEERISELINLLVKLQLADIYLDFETLYSDIYLGRDVWHILQYLIKLNNSGLNYFSYSELRTYLLYSGSLENLHRALLDYKVKLTGLSEEQIEDEIKLFFNYCLKIYISKDDKTLFNAVKLNTCFSNLERYKLTKEKIVNDYLAGYDVFSIIILLNFAESKLLHITYEQAKIYQKFGTDLKTEVINPALVPIIIDTPEVKVTTKDNIEIKTKLNIVMVLQIENLYNGFDQSVLCQLANSLFIEEVQRHYNHDEIIMNIEKIEKNILTKLYTESTSAILEYFDKSDMSRVEEEHHSGEDSEHQEENIHQEESHEKNQTPEHIDHLNVKDISLKQISQGHDIEFIKVSKYKPLKILIPRVEFVEATFKEFEKVKEEFMIHKEKELAKLETIRADIDLKRAWAESKDLKYLILKDDEKEDNSELHRGH